MKFEIEVDDHKIIASGTVIGIVNKPIVFKIEDLLFELSFIDNPEHYEQKLESNIPPNGKKMILIFENFNNSLGIGNLEPIKVGFIDDRTLLLNYRIYALKENTGKLLHYTWLLENTKGGSNVK
jgi:hypothetical protein